MSQKAIVVPKGKDFFKKGETIIKEGEDGYEMYIIKSGKVQVVKKTGDEEIVLATLEPKAFFGEMALFGEPKRSATIRAVEDTQMIVINKMMLESQFEKVPDWFVTILRTLVDRLRITNKTIKSRFRISFEFSVLKMIYLVGKRSGDKAVGGIIINLEKAREEISNILGITQDEFMERLKNLAFVGFSKYSEPKNQILIPDPEKVLKFISFLRVKVTNQPDDVDGTQSDPALKDHFEKLYKLLFRRKM